MPKLADSGPIFIVGCPRSGTTLLQRILDAHSEVAIAPETHFMRRFWLNRSRYGDLNADENFRQLVDDIIAAPEFSDYGLQQDEVRGAMASCERTIADVFATLLLTIRDSREARIVGEKTPNHVFFIDQIKTFFPSAHFVHIVRDPRSVINSWSRLPWTSGTAWQDAVRWRRHIRAADKYSGASLETIRYEDLVCQPVQSVQRLCQRLGIKYEPGMLNYWETPLLAFDLAREPWKGRALQPIDTSLATSWRHELTQAEIAQVEAVAWKEMLHHGYELHTPFWMLSGLIPMYFVLAWLDRARNSVARRVGRAVEHYPSQ